MISFRLLAAALFVSAALRAQAQVIISQPNATDNGGNGNQGQSFTPAIATSGSFPGASAYLTQFTFVVSGGGTIPSTPAYLLIYTSYTGGVGGTLLDVSTNTQTWSTIGVFGTATFSFTGGVALDKNTRYFAVFSESSTSVLNPTHDLRININNPYSGGLLLHQGSELAPWDAQFTATFATSAIPEPSACAALLALAALGLAARHRRRRTSSS